MHYPILYHYVTAALMAAPALFVAASPTPGNTAEAQQEHDNRMEERRKREEYLEEVATKEKWEALEAEIQNKTYTGTNTVSKRIEGYQIELEDYKKDVPDWVAAAAMKTKNHLIDGQSVEEVKNHLIKGFVLLEDRLQLLLKYWDENAKNMLDTIKEQIASPTKTNRQCGSMVKEFNKKIRTVWKNSTEIMEDAETAIKQFEIEGMIKLPGFVHKITRFFSKI